MSETKAGGRPLRFHLLVLKKGQAKKKKKKKRSDPDKELGFFASHTVKLLGQLRGRKEWERMKKQQRSRNNKNNLVFEDF